MEVINRKFVLIMINQSDEGGKDLFALIGQSSLKTFQHFRSVKRNASIDRGSTCVVA